MKITKFEDIESCKKARILTNKIYEVVAKSRLKNGFWFKGSDTKSISFYYEQYCRRL